MRLSTANAVGGAVLALAYRTVCVPRAVLLHPASSTLPDGAHVNSTVFARQYVA